MIKERNCRCIVFMINYKHSHCSYSYQLAPCRVIVTNTHILSDCVDFFLTVDTIDIYAYSSLKFLYKKNGI